MKRQGKFRRAFALLMALLLMVSAVTTSAFAAITQNQTGSITVGGIETTQGLTITASAYKLMDVNVNANGQPQTPVYSWVGSVADWVRTNYSNYIGTDSDNSVNEAFSAANAADIATFYDDLAAAIRGGTIKDFSPAQTATAFGGSANFSNLAMGNYLILVENGMRVYSPAAANLVPVWEDGAWTLPQGTIQVNEKSSEPSIQKTVKAPGTETGKDADNANIGDDLTFDITADVPRFPAKAVSKTYAISDKLPEGMTLNDGSIKVYGVKGDNETLLPAADAYKQEKTRPGSLGTSDFTLTFAYDKISSYDKIHVTYTAYLNGSAQLGTDGNVNTAYLDYSNNPYVTGSLHTMTDTAKVYTYGMKISKVDSDDADKFLAGAQFELYASEEDASAGNNPIAFVASGDGEYRRATEADQPTTTTLTVGSEGDKAGLLTLTGLDEGTWYLKETKAPDGYNLPKSPFTVTITDGTPLDGKVANSIEGNDAIVGVTIQNSDGFQLPTTGGMGTILFTAVGVALMGAAVVLIVLAIRRKKADSR